MRKYTRMDGYKATTGYTIRQDDRGYLWIGTDNGGVRFDGKHFKELQQIHHSGNSEILECIPMPGHMVLCIPIMGDYYILDHDTVLRSGMQEGFKKPRTKGMNIATSDIRTNTIWLWDSYFRQSIYKISKNGLTAFVQPCPDLFTRYSINDCFISVKADQRQLVFYDPATGRMQPFYHADGTCIDTVTERPIYPVNSYDKVLTYEKAQQLLHVYEWNGKDSILKEVNRFFYPVSFEFPPIYSLCSRQGKQYFFQHRPDKSFDYCADVAAKNAGKSILNINVPGMINSFLVDDHDNMWMSSSDNALYFLSGKHINNARLASKLPLGNNIPRSISGIGRSLCISYTNSNTLTFLSASGPKHFKLNARFNPEPRKVEALSDSSIVFYQGDIGVLDTRKNIIRYLDIKQATVKDVCLYKDGYLAACHTDVFFFGKGQAQNPAHSIFGKGRSTAVKVTAQDQILIGTPEGLYRKSGMEGEAVPAGFPQLEKEYVTQLLLPDKDHALIGTNNGIFLYNVRSDAVFPLTGPVADGRIPRRIRHLYRQDSLRFWAATDEGACALVFNPRWQLQSVKNYTFYDGLPSNNVSSIYTWNDTAYVATADGLGVIPVNAGAAPPMPAPRMYIDVLQAGPHFFSSPDTKVSLPDNRNELRILLSAISYESLGDIRYHYRLRPMQDEWKEAAEPEIRFTRLPPGTYDFEAFSTNAKGVRSHIVHLQIYLKPAYWQTIWFKILLVLLATAVLFILIRWRLKHSEKKRYIALQQKKHMAELELEAIKAQINPHFISNCLNSVQFLNYNAEYERAQVYLTKFAHLIRATLYYSRKVFTTVKEEIAYLSEYLQMEQLCLKDRLRYTIENELELNTQIPAMLLQPYVENALKHGLPSGGTVQIRFGKTGDDLHIQISDDGPGFSDWQSAESLGLRLSLARAQTYSELFNMQVSVQCYNKQKFSPEEGTGAVVCIIVKSNKQWKGQTYAPSS